MNKPRKISGKMILAVTQIVALTVLAACSSVGGTTLGATLADGNVVTACHATGDSSNPYQEITITGDIYPVPAYGCPTVRCRSAMARSRSAMPPATKPNHIT